MCGIMGAVAQRNVVPILIEGLRRLEYRGYDSAGLVVVNDELHCVRSAGRVELLARLAGEQDAQGMLGIAHTRWATHGVPAEHNAHPHLSDDAFAVVHNGIIENHESLRQQLEAAGYEFLSDTDTEVIVHLIHLYYQKTNDLLAAVQACVAQLQGAYAIAVVCRHEPNRMVCARLGSPLLIGQGIEEHFVASDAIALLPVTRRVIHLKEGDVADVRLTECVIYDASGARAERPIRESGLSAEVVDLCGHRHFMQKEIHEQPQALNNTLERVLETENFSADLFGLEAKALFSRTGRLLILACGTSYHAGMVAKYWIEALAGLPCNVEVASEFRYRQSVLEGDTLVVAISQSGETADTLAALNHASAGSIVGSLAICNVPESSIVRQSQLHFLTQAGPEIGVASTKAFTTQLAALMVLTLVLARLKGHLDDNEEALFLTQLRRLPLLVQDALSHEAALMRWAERLSSKRHALFLGRGMHYPIAMEGALKLKEISYIHVEAYPAGELKHGPLALVDEEMPVIALAPGDALLDKIKSNLAEVKARGGELYVLTDQPGLFPGDARVHVIELTPPPAWLSPLVMAVPLQLLAYHTALLKGTDVDKPRNLAKSVTVE